MNPKTKDVVQQLGSRSRKMLLNASFCAGSILLVAFSSDKIKAALTRDEAPVQTVGDDAAQSQASPSRFLKTSLAVDDMPLTPSVRHAASTDSTPDSAATENAKLSTTLDWSFGGKQQRGWQIYLPLIHRLIGTEADAAEQDFAHALSRWQRSSGLAPSGILDGNTWSRMVSTFQARRIKDRRAPSPEQLITAPSEDFYDPSRGEEFRRVERQTYDAYKKLVAAAVADSSLRLAARRDGGLAPKENRLKIISAFRSQEYQQQLRKKSPEAGRAGLALYSPHLTGRTLDLYVGGEPVSTKDHNRLLQTDTPVYRWLVKNADKFGFHPYFYEPWHWEYIPH